jgi:hypothetical protein
MTKDNCHPLLIRGAQLTENASIWTVTDHPHTVFAFQQNLTGRNIAVIIFSTNAWPVIRSQPQTVGRALANASPGTFTHATFRRSPRPRRRPPAPTC